jgi:hypothetical protein
MTELTRAQILDALQGWGTYVEQFYRLSPEAQAAFLKHSTPADRPSGPRRHPGRRPAVDRAPAKTRFSLTGLRCGQF